MKYNTCSAGGGVVDCRCVAAVDSPDSTFSLYASLTIAQQ